MNTLFLSIRKHYTNRTINKKEQICGNLSVAKGDIIRGSAPCAGSIVVNTRSRASTILKTLRTSVAWKRKNIPSFEVVQGNSSSSPDSGVDTAGGNNDMLPTTLAVKLEATLPTDSKIQIMAGTLDYNASISSPDESRWQVEDTLTQSPPISERKIDFTPVVDSPLSQGSDWTQEEDVTIRANAHLQIVKAMSSALLETGFESALSPLSELAASYELASISKVEVAASVNSISSSVFLKAMSSSDFNLAHEEIFGLSPPATPRTLTIV